MWSVGRNVILGFVQVVSPDDKFEVKICVEEAAVIVSAAKEPKTVCTITFTSPVMRDDTTGATEGGKRRRRRSY